jgi:superfamily I DNA/RNA helicase
VVQVLAGAGSGKTLLISARYLALLADTLEQPERYPQGTQHLLVLTFTEKASAEMRHRIEHHLAQAGYPQAHLPAERVGTFHQFALHLLRQHGVPSLGGGQSYGATTGKAPALLDESAQQALFTQLMERLMVGHWPNLASTLAEADLEGLVHPKALGLEALHAWPVREKTKLLEALPSVVKRIKASGLSPRAFYEAATRQTEGWHSGLAQLPTHCPHTGEPLETVEALLQHWQQHLTPWASTAWLNKVQQLPLEDKDSYKHHKATLERLWETKTFQQVEGRSATFGNKLVLHPTPNLQGLHAATTAELTLIGQVAAFYALYQQALRLEGALDFDDLILEACTLLERNEPLRTQLQGQLSALLVDEFQDTNGSQLRLLQLLMPPTPQPPHLTVVGDLKQSIYGFRFAQKENLHLIAQDRAPRHTFTLVANYRSHPAVVQVANVVASRLQEQEAADKPMVSAPSTHWQQEEPAVFWLNFGATQDEKEAAKAKAKTEAVVEPSLGQSFGYYQNWAEDWIAQEIEQQHRGPTQRPLQACCVLVRSRVEATRVAKALAAKGLPSVQDADAAWFTLPWVRRALGVLQVAANPSEPAPLWALLLQPLPPLAVKALRNAVFTPQETLPAAVQELLATVCPATLKPLVLLQALAQQALQPPPFLAEEELSSTWQAAQALLNPTQWQSVLALVEGLLPLAQAAAQQQPLSTLLAQTFEYLAHQTVLASPLQTQVYQSQCLALAQQWQQRTKPWLQTLRGFVAFVVKEAANNPRFKLPATALLHGLHTPAAVPILTMHAAKGLEFPVVFVYWLRKHRQNTDKLLLSFDPQFEGKPGFGLQLHQYETPTLALNSKQLLKPAAYKDVWVAPRAESEEQRLFYVALTRAKEALWVLRYQGSAPWTGPPVPAEWPESSATSVLPPLVLEGDETLRAVQAARYATAVLPPRPQPPVQENPKALSLALPSVAEAPAVLAVQSALRLSFSKLHQFSQCSTQFYWQSVLHREPPPAVASKALAATLAARLNGQVLHHWLEVYYRYGQQQPWEALQPLFRHSLHQQVLAELAEEGAPPEEAPALEAALWEPLLARFAAFAASKTLPYTWHNMAKASNALQVLAPEQTLRFALAHGGTAFRVQAKIDALFIEPSLDGAPPCYTLVDFKTHTAPPAPHTLQKEMEQLALYAYGLLQTNPHIALTPQRVLLVTLPAQAGEEPQVHSLEALGWHQPLQQPSVWVQAQLQALCQVAHALPEASLQQGVVGGLPWVPAPLQRQPPCQHCAYAPRCPHVR